MITESIENNVILSNVGATGEFKIQNSSRAFQILSSGLYSNKIRAIIRELSCNAIDSHAFAKKTDVPFEVHLPSILEPWFSVRDFGAGLSYDQVTEIYTTYFVSTKTQSNDYIGALGLGSKSPFSYTDNFSVTAIKDGKQCIFSAFINEEGVPSIALMGESATTEDNGVEVKFSVIEEHDYRKFRDEAAEVFRWFKHQPIIHGDYRPITTSYERQDIIPGVHLRNSGRVIAVMGNIAYPLDSIPNKEQTFGTLLPLLGCPLELHFNIGELDIAASREELSYIPSTISAIVAKFANLAEFIAIDVTKTANEIGNNWARAVYLSKIHGEKLYRASAELYVANTKFLLCDFSKHSKLHEFVYDNKVLAEQHITIRSLLASFAGVTCPKPHYRYNGTEYVSETSVYISDDAIFVLNDTTTGGIARIRYHFKQNGHRGRIYLLESDIVDMTERMSAYNLFLNNLHNPPTVVKLSELSKKVRDRVVPATILRCVPRFSQYDDDTITSILWDLTDTPNDTDICYYVPLTGNTPLKKCANGDMDTFTGFKEVCQLLYTSKIPGLSDKRIFGVRKAGLKLVEGNPNWVLLTDAISAAMNALSETALQEMVINGIVDNNSRSLYTKQSLLTLLPDTSPFLDMASGIKINPAKTKKNETTLELCKLFRSVDEVQIIEKSVEAQWADRENRYPLLQYLSWSTKDKLIADYIMLVDNSQTGN